MSDNPAVCFLVAAVAIVVCIIYFKWRIAALTSRSGSKVEQLQKAVAAYQQMEADLRRRQQSLAASEGEEKQRRLKLEQEYQVALARYNHLEREVQAFEENLEDISFGLYEPHFSFQASAEYKTALETLREQERVVIRAGNATSCPLNWSVGGNRREGERLVKLTSKAMLRAFNGECEAALANVAWNNITKMEERIRKSHTAINDLGIALHVSITPEFLEMKLNEVRLAYEYEQKKYQEKEEQRAMREKMREEERAQRELEEAQEEAEQQEQAYQQLLAKARKEAAEATGAQLSELTDKVSQFEAKLDEARRKKERAIARAQLTKAGTVYVISNIGTFGEGVYKIGMTRRLEPMERIMELSGAAVPFPFDVHVMFWSLNAPELECALHDFFKERRVNLVNARKEFYQNVSFAEIQDFVKQRGLSAQLVEFPEAREYRQTLARREELRTNADAGRMPPTFAESPFPTQAESAKA